MSPNATDPSLLEYGDCKTLAVNSIINDRALTIKLINSTSKKEIAKTVIDLTKACFIQPNKNVMLKAQQMTIEGLPDKGTLELKLRYVDGTVQPKAAGVSGLNN